MGTHGYFAYRYKRQYYRQHLRYDACPHYWGNRFAKRIPRDPREREAWISATIVMLEQADLKDAEYEEVRCAHEIETEEGLDGLGFNAIIDPEWTVTGIEIEWTYVIDLDNNVFTVNGSTHFKLDDMPPEDGGLEQFFHYDEELDKYLLVDTETHPTISKYLTTSVDLWPGPLFDVDEAQKKYEGLNPTTLSDTDWGLPAFSTLSVGQMFAMERIQIILDKYSQILDKGYLEYTNGYQLGTICLQLVHASTHIFPVCPIKDSSSYNRALGLLGLTTHGFGRIPRTEILASSACRWNPDFLCWREYSSLVGCTIAYCPILDQPAFVASEVGQIVENIRGDSEQGTGIIFSGRHIMIVRVEADTSDPQVYHSPVVEMYDREGRAGHGARLLVHFLQRDPSFYRDYDLSLPLPLEIMTQIIRSTDFGTYLCLTLVSWSIRAVCLAYPRVGDYTIVGQDLSHGKCDMFTVQHSATGSSTYFATLKNTSCKHWGYSEAYDMEWSMDTI